MKKSDVLAHYGSVKNASEKLGRGKSAISQWPEDLPFEIQCYIEVMSGGELKADRNEAPTSAA